MNIKRPNAFLYFLVYVLFYPFLKIFLGMKIDREGYTTPKGPCIVLANHLTMLDFIIAILSFYPHLLNTVTARKFFLYKPLHKLLPAMGCIGKNMFDPDVRSIVGIKTVLKNGGSVLLFPEGRCSLRGAYAGINIATGKLLKKLGVPVVSCYLGGVSVCAPNWRRWFRCGNIRVTHKLLLSEDDLKTMSAEEINATIDVRLSGKEGLSPLAAPSKTRFSRKLAKGLHRHLYYCPSCKQEFTTISEKNTLSCTACGLSVTMNRYGTFDGNGAPASISEWYKLQALHEMQLLSKDMTPIVEKVRVKTPSPIDGGGMADSGSGTLRIDPEGWHYDGELNGETVSLLFAIDGVPAITFEYEKNIQISYDGNYYVFIPEDLRKCVKYVIISECLHVLFASKPLLTPGVFGAVSE